MVNYCTNLFVGVPGFTAAMVRHLHSLRRMQRDHGWIHTLLEEAENERMHLMTFLQLRKPGPIFRFGVIATQYVFTGTFFLAYLTSPKFCHRYVNMLFPKSLFRRYKKYSGPLTAQVTNFLSSHSG